MSGTALLVTGGHSHPPELSEAALTSLLAESGLTADVTTDVDAAFTRLAADDPALVVVNALRWTMGHPRYDEHRAEWALSLSTAAREGMERWVASGGALLALHTALVSFDDWPEWGHLIGGAWDWDHSGHGPIGPVDVRCMGHDPLDDAGFTVTDECYVDIALGDDVEVKATMTQAGGPTQPACWVRRHGAGRVATSALGHDQRSLDDPEHRTLLSGLIAGLLADHPEDPAP